MDIKDVEKRVFKKLISNPKTLAHNLNKISPEDFIHIPIAREVIAAFGQNGNSIHYAPNKDFFEIMLRERIPEKEKLDHASGILAELAKDPEDQTDLDVLIKEIKANRMCRDLTRILQETLPDIDPARIEKTYDDLLKSILTLPLAGSSAHSTGMLKEINEDLEDRLAMYFKEGKAKIPCCVKAFNDTIGGFAPGEMLVLTAGTGQGKSAIMLWWALQMYKAGFNAVYFTLEMSYEEIMERYHAMITGLSIKRIRNKQLSEREQIRYVETIIADSLIESQRKTFLAECEAILDRKDPKYAMGLAQKFTRRKEKFHVIDIAKNCTPARIEREISRISLDNKVHIAVVDYINIVEPNFHSKDYVREQGTIAKDLKEVARKTGCLMITAAQMNTPKDGAPITTDSIKYARAISENTDWLIGFHRDADDLATKLIRLELAKHRFSASATAALEVDFETMTFTDMGHANSIAQPDQTSQDKAAEGRAANTRAYGQDWQK